MRRKKTAAEKALWPLLKPLGFKNQVIIAGYIADFASKASGLIIEADGQHHCASDIKEYDVLRDWNLFRRGYKVLRFSNKQIISEPASVALAVVELIRAAEPFRYSKLKTGNAISPSRKQAFLRPSVHTATDRVAAISHEYVVLGSADQYIN